MDEQINQLHDILKQQVSAHEQLLMLIKRKRRMLQTADHRHLADLSGQENRVVQAVGELEKERLALVGRLTLAIDPAAKEPMRLADLAQRLEEPGRGHLLVLRQQLKERMEQAKRETTIAKRATESLVRHMQGLIQTVGSVVTGVSVYGRQGAPPRDTVAVRTFNVTA